MRFLFGAFSESNVGKEALQIQRYISERKEIKAKKKKKRIPYSIFSVLATLEITHISQDIASLRTTVEWKLCFDFGKTKATTVYI